MPDRGRRMIRWGFAILAALSVLATGAGPSAAQRPGAANNYPEPPRHLTAAEQEARLARKRQLVAELQSEAQQRAGPDRVKYTTLLREGLARIEQQILDEAIAPGERSFGARSSTPRGFSALPAKTEAIDRSAAGQRSIQDETLRPRISHGRPVPEDKLKDVVALRGPGVRPCTGVRIGPNAVLTAAHCFCDFGEGRPKTFDGDVRFGSTEASSVSLRISTVRFLDPEFCRQPRQGRDLAVAFFAGEAPGEPAVIMEPVYDYLFGLPADLVVAGFGRTETGTQGRKNVARVPVRSRLCATADQCLPGREVLLADPGGFQDTCPGDSGGPAYQVVMQEGNAWYLSAITSRGVRSLRSCGDGGIYTLVTRSVVSWLCSIGAAPTVNRVGNLCNRSDVQAAAALSVFAADPDQRSPEVAQPPLRVPATSGPAKGPKNGAALTPGLVGRSALASYLETCQSSCRSDVNWDCTEQCSCRMLCEAQPQGDASACAAFCAQQQ